MKRERRDSVNIGRVTSAGALQKILFEDRCIHARISTTPFEPLSRVLSEGHPELKRTRKCVHQKTPSQLPTSKPHQMRAVDGDLFLPTIRVPFFDRYTLRGAGIDRSQISHTTLYMFEDGNRQVFRFFFISNAPNGRRRVQRQNRC